MPLTHCNKINSNIEKYILQIDQVPLSLDREYLMKGLSDKIVDAYYRYMVDTAVILGADKTRAEEELKESLEFEIKLAKVINSNNFKLTLEFSNILKRFEEYKKS